MKKYIRRDCGRSEEIEDFLGMVRWPETRKWEKWDHEYETQGFEYERYSIRISEETLW